MIFLNAHHTVQHLATAVMILVNFVVESDEAFLLVRRHLHRDSKTITGILERHDIAGDVLAVTSVKDIHALPTTVIGTLVCVFHARNLTDDVHLLLHGSNITSGCSLLHKKEFFFFSEKSENWRESMLGENYLEFSNPVTIAKSTKSTTPSFTTKSKTYLTFIRNLFPASASGNIILIALMGNSTIQLVNHFSFGHICNYSFTRNC